MFWFLILASTSLIQISLTSPVASNFNKTTRRLSSSDGPQNERTINNLASQPTLLVTDNGRQLVAGANRGTNRLNRQGKRAKDEISQMFREEVTNYPEDEIKRLLKQTSQDLRNLYNVIDTHLDPNATLTERVAYYNGEEDDSAVREESACRFVTRNIYPREAHRQNSLVYIANNHEFVQVIQAELCQNPDEECSSFLSNSLPYGMSSVCKQKYAFKKLLYMDSLEKQMRTDLFRYPSCCSCYLRTSPFDLRTGLGKLNATANSNIHQHNNKTLSDSKSDDNKTIDSHILRDRKLITDTQKGIGGKQQANLDTHNKTLVLADD